MNGWIEPPSLGAQGVLFMPLGALGRAPICLARDLPWGRSELCFHKLSIVQIFLIQPFLVGAISLTSELQTMQIRCLGCVPRNYIQLWYTLVSLKTKIRSPKIALEDNLSDFGLVCAAGISGDHISYLLDPNWAFHMSKSKLSSRRTTLVFKFLALESV
jgi:hypothetical protein